MSGNTSISGLSHTDTPRNGRAAGAGGPGTGWDDYEDPDLSRTNEAPIIIEPSGGVGPQDPSTRLYTSTSCITDLSGQLTSWFTHSFTSAPGDLNLPTVLSTAAGTTGSYPALVVPQALEPTDYRQAEYPPLVICPSKVRGCVLKGGRYIDAFPFIGTHWEKRLHG
jgi:hypothetical protein